jgi:hypothetical protein
MSVLISESIQWVDVKDQMPDSELTVLVSAPEASEPVWLGYHDGDSWFSVDGMGYGNEEEQVAQVVAWAEMPKGPA